MKKPRFLFRSYVLVVVLFFFYSFTQVDLNLTLSKWSIWQILQKFFQHIGYFQRPFSTFLYIAILILLFTFYVVFLYLAHSKKITKKQVWILVISTASILVFSYNAFSYDLFNYIFDAKIVTFYHQNPYLHKALDFPSDPMLNFMRWTHRVYPYGPVWLFLTVPISFLGLNFFLPTFFLFKFLAAGSYLGTAYFIDKIMTSFYPKDEVFGLVFFALNPLVIIESLVSGHNDITMILFALIAVYLFLKNKYIRSILFILLSIGIKFATFFILPIFLAIYFLGRDKRHINLEWIFLSMTLVMIFAVFLASVRTNFQPWYLLYPLPFAALIRRKYLVLVPSIIVTFFALLEYSPFLYLGNWDKPVPTILSLLTLISIILSLGYIVVILLTRINLGKNLIK